MIKFDTLSITWCKSDCHELITQIIQGNQHTVIFASYDMVYSHFATCMQHQAESFN